MLLGNILQAVIHFHEMIAFFDNIAARGKMAVRELIVFKHDSELGNAPAYKLFEKVQVKPVEGVEVPRKYGDYVVSVSDDLPEGVHCERLS